MSLNSPVRPLLSTDLPLIDQATTIGHLLSQTSGPRHYLDVPVHTLEGAEGFLPVLDGHAQVSTPGQRFTYNNAGNVLLTLLAQRVAGESFHDLVRTRVLEPAGMGATDFPQSDEPGPGVAHGYLHEKGLRTNVLHLPVRGSGDGGAVTAAPISPPSGPRCSKGASPPRPRSRCSPRR